MAEEFTLRESKLIAGLDAFNAKIAAKVPIILSEYEEILYASFPVMHNLRQLEILIEIEELKARKNVQKEMEGMDLRVMQIVLDKLKCDLASINKNMIDGFEITLQTRAKVTNFFTEEARKMYEIEWKKYYGNSKFQKFEDLVQNDAKIQALVCKKILEKQKLLPSQISEIKNALRLTFQSHKREFDMWSAKDFALGIDLGTTYTCVAVYQHGEVKIIPNPVGSSIIPSCVRMGDNGKMEKVGIEAKETAYQYVENTVMDAKRIIGRKYDDPRVRQAIKSWAINIVERNGVPKFSIGTSIIPPERISAEILLEMKRMADEHLGTKVMKAVITVPAYFGDTQHQATIDAAKIAGLDVLAILAEPIAASVAFRLDHFEAPTRQILIYDLGGGTFDVAVLKISEGDIEIIAMGGDSYLGGRDFDHNMMKYCVEEFQRSTGIYLMKGFDSSSVLERRAVKRRLQRIQSSCENKKLHLSAFTCNMVEIDVASICSSIDGHDVDLKVQMTKKKFDEINKSLFDSTITKVEECLNSKSIAKGSIDDIVLVGGSTKIPKIRELLSAYFEGAALSHQVNPDKAVAYGAAIHAAVLNGQISRGEHLFSQIQDITPISIGIEIEGELFSKIIPRHTKVPATLTETYCTSCDDQTVVEISAYQGENEDIALNSLLGTFTVTDVPPGPKGHEKIDVTMEIGTNGVLNVTAVCLSTGQGDKIKIKSNKWLLIDDEIKEMQSTVGLSK